MHDEISRRSFIGAGAAVFSTGLVYGNSMGRKLPDQKREVRVGIVGTGGRGCSLLRTMLSLGGVQVPALCDINQENLQRGMRLVEKAGGKKPDGYFENETIYETMFARSDLNAVIIATPWQWHTPMAVSAMQNGLYTGVEVPAALTLDQCWQLVDTYEQTNQPDSPARPLLPNEHSQ